MVRSAGRWWFRSAIISCIAIADFDGSNDARKLQQKAVAGVLHDPAAVIEDDRVDRASMGLERGVRSRLIGAHHSRVAGDVGADYRG